MARSQNAGSSVRDEAPNNPTDLSGGSWLAAARRALKEYKADDLQDRAAALTYFGIQSIFPGLLVLVSLLGVLGKSATQPHITNLGNAAPASVRKIIMTDVTPRPGSSALPESCSPCGRRPTTSRPSCAPPTSFTMCPRAGLSGKPRPSA
jgi:membrane protein